MHVFCLHHKCLFRGEINEHCIYSCRESCGEAESQTVAAQESVQQQQQQWTSEDSLDDETMEP